MGGTGRAAGLGSGVGATGFGELGGKEMLIWKLGAPLEAFLGIS